jgi:hypothetical protein
MACQSFTPPDSNRSPSHPETTDLTGDDSEDSDGQQTSKQFHLAFTFNIPLKFVSDANSAKIKSSAKERARSVKLGNPRSGRPTKRHDVSLRIPYLPFQDTKIVLSDLPSL